MILDFPYIYEPVSCGYELILMVAILNYYGFDKISKNNLNDEIYGFPEKENTVEKITRISKKYGLNCISKKSSIEEIVDSITNNIPVIINLQAWSNKSSIDYSEKFDYNHFAIAIGFQDDNIIFSDSASIYRTFLSYEELNRRWHSKEGNDKYFDHLAIFISGKTPDFTNKKVKKME